MALSADLIGRIQQLAQHQETVHAALGERALDDHAIGRQLALRRKLERHDFSRLDDVCLGHNLRHALPLDARRHYTRLPKDFLAGDFASLPERAVYLLLNNDIGKLLPQYLALVEQRPASLFVVWDWDSQHWLQMSGMLAAHSDFYLPSTSENLYTLSHFSPHLLGPVPVAVNQWSRAFIVEHMDKLLAARSDAPFGPHVRYDNFARRNRALSTLNKSFPGIAFADHGYQVKSELDNLLDWAGHKTHWIVPVLGGVPIRVFNCLLTGGIPVLPSFYRQMPEVMSLGDSPVWYDVFDLVEPGAVQQQASARFDAAGPVGVAARVGQALQTAHVDTRCETVLRAVEDAVRCIVSGDRTVPARYLMNPAADRVA